MINIFHYVNFVQVLILFSIMVWLIFIIFPFYADSPTGCRSYSDKE